jgi:hypothetical protein
LQEVTFLSALLTFLFADQRNHVIFVQTQEAMGSDCFAVSAPRESGYSGFYAFDFAWLRASYNEYKGLLLRIPASVNDRDNEKRVGDIQVRISRKNNNSVTIEGE